MWKIIKSEIEYLKIVIIAVIAFIIFVNTLQIIQGRWFEELYSFPGRKVIWLSLVLTNAAMYLAFYRRSNRIRLHVLLPIKRKVLPRVRTIMFIALWLSVAVFQFIFYVAAMGEFPDRKWTFDILSLSSIMVFLLAFPALQQDFNGFQFSKIKYMWISGTLGAASIILYVGFILMASFFEFLPKPIINFIHENGRILYFSERGILILMIIGLLFMFFSLVSFRLRKTYLE